MRYLIKPDTFVSYLVDDFSDIPYTSSGTAYEYCKTNLRSIQNGLCAYTEISLGASSQIDHWDPVIKFIDGFNPHNLFMISSGINLQKRTRKPNILKPDDSKNPPQNLISYNITLNEFYALKTELYEKVKEDIEILGLNEINIVTERKNKIKKWFESVRLLGFRDPDFEDFPTAVEFYKQELLRIDQN